MGRMSLNKEDFYPHLVKRLLIRIEDLKNCPLILLGFGETMKWMSRILDEAALLACLESGRLAGAALDVFCSEPYMGPLRYLPNVIFSAHIGASAKESRRLMELGAAEAVIAFNHSQPWKNYVV